MRLNQKQRLVMLCLLSIDPVKLGLRSGLVVEDISALSGLSEETCSEILQQLEHKRLIMTFTPEGGRKHFCLTVTQLRSAFNLLNYRARTSI